MVCKPWELEECLLRNLPNAIKNIHLVSVIRFEITIEIHKGMCLALEGKVSQPVPPNKYTSAPRGTQFGFIRTEEMLSSVVSFLIWRHPIGHRIHRGQSMD